MCLAVPGQVESIEGNDPLTRRGRVNFGGIVRDVSLAFVPEANIGDFVIVHVGVAISRLDQEAARQTLSLLSQMLEDPGEERVGP